MPPAKKDKKVTTQSKDPNPSPKATPISKSETDMINEAMRVGLIIYPSKDYIWKVYRQQNTDELQQFESKFLKLASETGTTNLDSLSRRSRMSARTKNSQQQQPQYDFSLIKFLNLSYNHLSEIGDLYLCKNIRILNLADNYLTRIEPLIHCMHLIRLDLHKNQIKTLPDPYFWSSLKKLKVLYLHNNPIAKTDNIKRLSMSSVEVLTLSDTPLSLKKNYRHLVVNLIVSLKALDSRIVADDEIIEDAKFPERFSSKNKVFQKSLLVPKVETNNFKDELAATYQLLREVNQVIAHHSPVTIIQKYIRGHIDRRYAKLRRAAMLWAVVAIQKWWRRLKRRKYNPDKNHKTIYGITNDMKSLSLSSLSSNTSLNRVKSKSMRPKILVDMKNLNDKSESLDNILKHTALNVADAFIRKSAKATVAAKRSKSDFDLYEKRLKSIDTTATSKSHRQHTPTRSTYSHSATSSKRVKQESELSGLFKSLANTTYPTSYDEVYTKKSDISRLDLDKKYIDTRMYLNSCNDGRKYTKRPHRLPPLAVKLPVNEHKDYVHDLITEKKFYSENVHLLQMEAHDRLAKVHEVKRIKYEQIKTLDQRYFQKAFGNMSLGCLKAVDKAYVDRNNAERQQAKQDRIQQQRENKDFMKKNVQFYRDERLRDVQKAREVDKVQLEVTRRRLDLDKMQEIEGIQEVKTKRREFTIDRRKDILLAVDFNKQHLSVSKALQKHEFDLEKDEMFKANVAVVTKLRAQDVKQLDIVKRYLNLRNLKRVVENKHDKQRTKSNLSYAKNFRQFIAKNRVYLVNSSKQTLTNTLNVLRSLSKNSAQAGSTVKLKPVTAPPRIAFRTMRSYLDQLQNLEYDDDTEDEDDDDESGEYKHQKHVVSANTNYVVSTKT